MSLYLVSRRRTGLVYHRPGCRKVGEPLGTVVAFPTEPLAPAGCCRPSPTEYKRQLAVARRVDRGDELGAAEDHIAALYADARRRAGLEPTPENEEEPG